MLRNKLETLRGSKFASIKVKGILSDIGPTGGGNPPVARTVLKDGRVFDKDMWTTGRTACLEDKIGNGPNGDLWYFENDIWHNVSSWWC